MWFRDMCPWHIIMLGTIVMIVGFLAHMWTSVFIGRWLGLIICHILMAAICALAQWFHGAQVYRLLFLINIVIGMPASLLWTYNPAWPFYIPFTGINGCIFLFTTILYFLSTTSSPIINTTVLLLTIYLMITPALLICYGDLPCFQDVTTPAMVAYITASLVYMVPVVWVCALVFSGMHPKVQAWRAGIWFRLRRQH